MRWSGRDALAASAVALALAAGGAAFASDTMKLAAAAVTLPADTGPKELSGLVLETPAWACKIHSIRLKELPGEAASEVTWVLATSSTAPRLRRVDVDLFLLDEQDTRLASAHQTVMLTFGTEKAEQKIKMKLPAGSWSKARAVRIEVRFKS